MHNAVRRLLALKKHWSSNVQIAYPLTNSSPSASWTSFHMIELGAFSTLLDSGRRGMLEYRDLHGCVSGWIVNIQNLILALSCSSWNSTMIMPEVLDRCAYVRAFMYMSSDCDVFSPTPCLGVVSIAMSGDMAFHDLKRVSKWNVR